MTFTSNCPSEFRWDCFFTQTLSSAEREAFQIHLAHCPVCQSRERARLASFGYLDQLPEWEVLVREVPSLPSALLSSGEVGRSSIPQKQGLFSGWFSWSSFSGWGLRTAKFALLLPLLFLALPFVLDGERVVPPGKEMRDVAKSKESSVQMLHYRPGASISHLTKHGEVLYPGDLVQFSYEFSRPLHLLVLSINEREQISVYVPFGQSKSIYLTRRKGTCPSTGSLELDEYVGFERFFMVTSQTPISVSLLKKALQKGYKKAKMKLRDISLVGAGWSVRSLLIRKHHHPKDL